MAIVVEDGTGKSNSNSYISVADAETYNDNHDADSVWDALSDANKEKSLKLATAYLDNTYQMVWLGTQTNEDQALDWPRTGVTKNKEWTYDSDEMPQVLLDATVEAAIVSGNGTNLMPHLTNPVTKKRQKNKVGPLEQDTEYQGGNSPVTVFSKVASLVESLIAEKGMIQRA